MLFVEESASCARGLLPSVYQISVVTHSPRRASDVREPHCGHLCHTKMVCATRYAARIGEMSLVYRILIR
jgi:hypothetical protein